MGSEIVNEEIHLTGNDIHRLAKCSYYFLKRRLPEFGADSSRISDSQLEAEMGTVDLYEFVGDLFLGHIESFWAGQLAQGDCQVDSVLIADSAYEVLDGISGSATRSLLEDLWPGEFNSRREACWIIGNVLTNEVIVSIMENVIANNTAESAS